MKILFVLPQIYPFYTGGAEIFHYHLLIELAKNHSVGYIGYDNINKEKINFYRVKKLKPLRLFVPIQTIIQLIKQKKKYDIVHLNYSHSSVMHWLYYPILKYLFRIEYVITIHDGRLYEWQNKYIFRTVFNHAKFVVAVSERLKEEYEKRCNRIIEYLAPLIPFKTLESDKDSLLEKFGYNKNDKIILFAGSLKEIKRPLILIEAINLINRSILDKYRIKVIIAGSGPQEEELNIKINQYHLNSYIKLVGRIPQEKLNTYYKIASIYVLPSIHEGKSVSLIEAMYNQLPIIASNAPGINDIVNDNINGMLFELDNPADLSKKIIKIITDESFARSIASNAYLYYLNNFQYSKMLEEYVNLYRK